MKQVNSRVTRLAAAYRGNHSGLQEPGTWSSGSSQYCGVLIGIAYLMGHKHVTTTKEYLHSNLEEAQAVLFRTSFFTSPAEAAPTTAELIALLK